MSRKIYLMLDVGGTKIKGGLLTQEGQLLDGEILEFDAKSSGEKEEIFENMVNILDQLLDRAEESSILGIGMAFPGPFDYERGISEIRGIGKYDAIYGLAIPDGLRGCYGRARHADQLKPGIPIAFVHDIEAFALGESMFGKAAPYEKVMYLCIGTGAGSAFTGQGRILREGAGVPPNGWLYNTPYRESIIDDYLSVRGLMALTCRYYGEKKSGLELYHLAQRGDEKALEVFDRFGIYLCEALEKFLDEFAPDALILGGQTSKSFSYFGKGLLAQCEKRKIVLHVTSDTSKYTLQGLYVKFQCDKI